MNELYRKLIEDPSYFDEVSKSDLVIKEGSVGACMHYQAELYRKWAQLYAISADHLSRLKDHIKDVVWSDCYLRAIDTLESEDKRATEKKVEALAKSDPAWQRHQQLMRDAELIAANFRAMEQAMIQRKEMLQSINSRQCKELSSI